MSWNFILLIFINTNGDESSLYSRINYPQPDEELLCNCPDKQKTMHTGLTTRSTYCYTFPVLTRKKPDVMI